MNAQRHQTVESRIAVKGDSAVDIMTEEEARAAFDCAAQQLLNMSGDEFLRKWVAGDFDRDPDQPGVIDLIMLLPLVR